MFKTKKPILLRITTVPMSLRYLITGQMALMKTKGLDVHMASADGDHLKEAMLNEGVPHHILPFKRDISVIDDIKALLKMIQLVKKLKPTIIHTHTPKAGLIGMLASRICNVPLRIHTVAGMPLEGLTGFKKKVVTLTEKLTYASANQVWPNSPSLKNFILKNRFTSSSKLHVIGKGSSNGIDLNQYSHSKIEDSALNKIKQQIKFNDRHKYMTFVGRLVSQKGIIELVTAFIKVNKQFSDWKLILVGPFEDDRDPVPQTIKKEINANPDIIAVGFSDNVRCFLSISDLLVFPSHREGFPNVALQAGAMNCPVIASDIMGNIDIIIDQKTGLLFKSKDLDDLMEKLVFAIQNPDHMKNLADANYKRIAENFTREYVQQEIYKKYSELLSEGS